MNRSAQHRAALDLIAAGLKVFPLAANTKTPPKGHHGWREATSNPDQVNQWFAATPRLNIGVDLFSAALMVVDIDTASRAKNGHSVHQGANGAQSLLAYLKAHNLTWPDGGYSEQTPHNGRHVFFKLPHSLTRPIRKTGGQSGLPGVDLLGDFVTVAPSVIDGRSYLTSGPISDLLATPTAPSWLVDLLTAPPKERPTTATRGPISARKRWTGQLFDRIANGATTGHRNAWLASVTGQILRVGTDPANTYELAHAINQYFIRPPLPESEVNAVFNSVAKYHR